jgi:DNA-binding transcriptional MerR regulator
MIAYPVTTKQAADITGISRQSLRAYTARYARFLSTDATPAAGIERKFTEADLRTLRFVYGITSAGRSHDEAIERLQAGELADFDWQAPEPTTAPADARESMGALLVPIERLQASAALLEDARQREAAALARAEELAAENARLLKELGRAEGKLSARYRAPVWWRTLFGGSAE